MLRTTMPILVTVTLAFVGYLATYAINLRIARRRERLDLINHQITDFYGPLFIIASVGSTAYDALVTRLRREHDPDLHLPLNDKDFREWRIWMTHVFMPNNERLERLILDNAHLIRERELPPCLLRFITHVAGYKAVIEKWKQGNFAEESSIIDFPNDILEYAAAAYRELKREQLELIGHKSSALRLRH